MKAFNFLIKMSKEKFKEIIERHNKLIFDDPEFFKIKNKWSNKFAVIHHNGYDQYLYIYSIYYRCECLCIFCDMFYDYSDTSYELHMNNAHLGEFYKYYTYIIYVGERIDGANSNNVSYYDEMKTFVTFLLTHRKFLTE
jgi:hypothetical protein